ncbi:hypothetical protein KC19_VG084800 [Ceratodon purpureus]|uniref:Uncharacterized protein n=1 Tax=Ceratodon purpureus TaxID=3225 RepID=A0A8T0HNE3_CERPU|nr:hypothetical protein KC19_VG084800 [Ceratodon purpureus]
MFELNVLTAKSDTLNFKVVAKSSGSKLAEHDSISSLLHPLQASSKSSHLHLTFPTIHKQCLPSIDASSSLISLCYTSTVWLTHCTRSAYDNCSPQAYKKPI